VVSHRQVEVTDMGANVVHDRRKLGPSLCVFLTEHEHPDGFVEFAYPPDASAQLQLRVERNLEETVPDLLVREACSLRVAPIADVGILSMRGAADGSEECNPHRGDDCGRPFWKGSPLWQQADRRWRSHADTGASENAREWVPGHGCFPPLDSQVPRQS